MKKERDARLMFKSDWTHPELKKEEILLINITEGEIKAGRWTTPPSFISELRIGEVAYTTGGVEIVQGYKPLFGVLKKVGKII